MQKKCELCDTPVLGNRRFCVEHAETQRLDRKKIYWQKSKDRQNKQRAERRKAARDGMQNI